MREFLTVDLLAHVSMKNIVEFSESLTLCTEMALLGSPRSSCV